jgi:MoaA/NifB/PqqE/SkfB family radical SAM enzyme
MVSMDILEPFNRYKWKRHFNGLKNEIIAGGIPEPSRATIELTMRCNLSCQMCFRDRGQEGELSLEELKTVVDNISPSIRQINLIGGEVFLRSDIFEILDYLRDRNLRVRIQTNGTLLGLKKLQKLSGYWNVTGVGFSIDGPRELHNQIRGSKAAYDKTIEAIKNSSEFFSVSVNTVLLDENFGEIETVFRTLRELGISEYRIEPEMFATPEEVIKSGVEPIAANIKKDGSYSFSANDLIGLKKRLDKLAEERDIKVVIAPRVAEIDAEEFIAGTIRENKKLFCKHLLVPRIDSEGNLIFCHIIKKRFGSLKDTGLDELWNGEEIKLFRRNLLEQNLLPVCKRCCRLRTI